MDCHKKKSPQFYGLYINSDAMAWYIETIQIFAQRQPSRNQRRLAVLPETDKTHFQYM